MFVQKGMKSFADAGGAFKKDMQKNAWIVLKFSPMNLLSQN